MKEVVVFSEELPKTRNVTFRFNAAANSVPPT